MYLVALAATFYLGQAKGELAKAETKTDLVRALWQDQNQEKAFRVFIEALNEAKIEPVPLSEEEKKVYEESLKLYLGHRPDEARPIAKKIDEIYAPLLKEHPEWFRLGFVVAVAKANLQDYEQFFALFYPSYIHDPDHFLALKTMAILHIKLFERSKSLAEREHERKEILRYISAAERAYPGDFSLYGIHIAYAPQQKKEILQKILTLNLIPSRTETLYFLKMVQSTEDKPLIDAWSKKAQEWYPGSRSILNLLN